MTTVQQLLKTKGHEVISIGPDETVFEAIRKMADKEVGSLVIIENGKPVGIFTERHYARNVFLKGKSSPETPVRDVMKRHVICVTPEQTVKECMAVMTEHRIRHLPVVQEESLLGIVSIGDLVKAQIAHQKFTIDQLVHFIGG